MELGREQIDRWDGHLGEEAADLARLRGQELAVEAHHFRGLLHRPEGRTRHHGRAQRMSLELERGHHAEVPAATTERPEQIGMLARAGVDLRAIGQHHVGSDQVVDREPEAPRQMADTAAECEPADAGRRDDPRGRHAAMLGRRAVDLAPGRAAPDTDRVGTRVDRDVGHPAEIDHDPVVDGAQAPAVVPSPADCHRQAVGAPEGDATSDVLGVRAPHDDRRPFVDHSVVNRSGLFVARVVRSGDPIVEIGQLAARGIHQR